MPKISVNEKDLSWYVRQRDPSDLVVYVPGIATFGPYEPTLVDATTFANVFGKKSVEDPRDTSYDLAASYLAAGCNVLFHRIPLTGANKAWCSVFLRATAGDTGTGSGSISATAKYEGTFGNTLSLKYRCADHGVFVFFIYGEGGSLLETLTCNFIDPADDHWYEKTNMSSHYVDVTLSGTYFDEWEESSSDTEKKFSTGKDYDKEGYSAYDLAVEDLSAEGYFDDLLDPYQYTFNVVTCGGFNTYTVDDEDDGTTVNTTMTDIDKSLSDLASGRGTAIYLVDGHPDWDDKDYYNYCALFNSSYAAAFGPWQYAQYLSTGALALVPGNYVMLVRWAQSVSDGNPTWLAPAGVKRAQLGSFVKSSKYPVGKTILDSWQNQESIAPGACKVNPIMKLKSYGYCIYGNSTLLHNGADGSTSMLQSFSVRVLSNAIKSHAFDVSLSLQFDQITDDLFAQFKSLMGVYMDQLKYQGALYDYRLIVDRSAMTDVDLNNKNVPVRIQISPNPAAENFTINLEISQAGVTFSDDTDETEVA